MSVGWVHNQIRICASGKNTGLSLELQGQVPDPELDGPALILMIFGLNFHEQSIQDSWIETALPESKAVQVQIILRTVLLRVKPAALTVINQVLPFIAAAANAVGWYVSSIQ